MNINGKLSFLKFDSKNYRKDVLKLIEKQFIKGARAFVRAAVPLVPVQTGMARGSFLNIGRLINLIIPINPTKFNKKYYHRPGYSGEDKTPELGASYSTPERDIITVTKTRLEFHFQTKVFHYLLHDEFDYQTSAWHSFTTGQKAFLDVMSDLINVLPQPKAYVTKTEVSFGRGSGLNIAAEKPLRVRIQRTVRPP